jgi:hypothetical protein
MTVPRWAKQWHYEVQGPGLAATGVGGSGQARYPTVILIVVLRWMVPRALWEFQANLHRRSTC